MLATSLLLRNLADLGPSVSVLAVVLTRTLRRVRHENTLAVIELSVVAMAASGVG